MRASATLLFGLLLTASLAPAVGADHLQASGGRSVSFDHKGGNEWWAEARLGGPDASAVSRVEAMDADGAWKALSLRAWGHWAASFHVEPGHLVRFRATFPDGTQVTSCDFAHPEGAERCGATFDASFSGVKGNAWWVEAKVGADKPLAGVDARVDGGGWRALSPRWWGAWAASFAVPDGSLVQLRARDASGAAVESAEYVWPGGKPVPRPAWPAEGSHVAYYAEQGERSPGGDYAEWDEVNVTLTYRDGRWEASCEGWSYLYLAHREPALARERILAKALLAPPRGPTNVTVGSVASVGVLDGCAQGGDRFGAMTVTGSGGHPARKDGDAVTSPAWNARWDDACACMGSTASWHQGTGLTLDWWSAGRSSHTLGHLKDTDAPIA